MVSFASADSPLMFAMAVPNIDRITVVTMIMMTATATTTMAIRTCEKPLFSLRSSFPNFVIGFKFIHCYGWLLFFVNKLIPETVKITIKKVYFCINY